ncbi:MAG: 30S ribosomal protein S2 [Candidatus Bathyarchaeota archaeon]|nr:30S ribosomal protein S2 [Candidatus Bathyarchaeota archaeon]
MAEDEIKTKPSTEDEAEPQEVEEQKPDVEQVEEEQVEAPDAVEEQEAKAAESEQPEEAEETQAAEEETQPEEVEEEQAEDEEVQVEIESEEEVFEEAPEAPETPTAPSDGEDLLLPRDTLLSAGIHIGTRMKTQDMEPFIYRVRPDGLFVLDVKKTDDRIRVAGKFLARYDPSKIAVAATRLYAHEPIRKFCQLTGSMPLIGRFIPGMLSNPLYPNRVDPEIIVVSDPRADAQAVKEASDVGIPIVALCSTDNEFSGVDLVIPTNNKGRRALAVIFWLLSRQVLRERGELAADQNPKVAVEDFEAKISHEED